MLPCVLYGSVHVGGGVGVEDYDAVDIRTAVAEAFIGSFAFEALPAFRQVP